MAKLRITYAKSAIGYSHRQKNTIRSLGLRKLNSVVVKEDNAAIRGMIFKVQHLVKVEEVEEGASEAAPAAPAQVRTLRPVAAEPKADNLEIIEGIGPKIASLLVAEGFTSFAKLAATDVATIEAILTKNRLSHISDPATWPQQAGLAAEGKFDELKALQGSLRGGRAV